MQVYPYKLDVEGARYETVKGGFSFSRNGCTFTEVMNRENKTKFIQAEIKDSNGGSHWDIMSLKNWAVIRHSMDAICGMVKQYSEGEKARGEAKVGDCLKLVKGLKVAGLTVAGIKAAALAEGFTAELVEASLKAAEPAKS